jgi:phage nucleotide-binding protein
MRYLDGIKTIPDTEATNALILGTALHTGIEEGLEAGIQYYINAFPIISDAHINEMIKLEHWIPKVREMLPEGIYEQAITGSDFIGFADLLVPVESSGRTKVFDLYDFKYSSNQKSYMESGQLHEYKYFIEKTHPGWKIRNMFFVFVPKVSIKQKKTESLMDFRERIQEQLNKESVQIVPIEYNPNKVVEFAMNIKTILETKDFPKEKSFLCGWCEYQEFCESEVDYMLLPKNERRNIETIDKKVVWLYGVPFSGKTFLANKFPDPIMLNTDGNIKFVDAPYVSIKDEVKNDGSRNPKRTLAWANFKDVITELEKKDNTFKTVVVDLLEDCYEHCRIYMYDKLNITHESDDSFSAWDKVRTEFLSTLKRLMNMDYENIILISHEDRSKDITRKGGDKITAIKPNLPDKVANKIAGMVDIVARVVADGDERTLSFKTNEVIFGGGRLTVTKKEIPLDYDDFMAVYDEANGKAVRATRSTSKKQPIETPSTVNTEEVSDSGSEDDSVAEASTADSLAPEVQEAEPVKEEKAEEPKPRTRKKRGE